MGGGIPSSAMGVPLAIHDGTDPLLGTKNKYYYLLCFITNKK